MFSAIVLDNMRKRLIYSGYGPLAVGFAFCFVLYPLHSASLEPSLFFVHCGIWSLRLKAP